MLKEKQKWESKHKAKGHVLKKLIKKVRSTATTVDKTFIVPTLTSEQQQAQAQVTDLRATTAPDPCQRKQLENLANAILKQAGLNPLA